jgi:hypothetical protein
MLGLSSISLAGPVTEVCAGNPFNVLGFTGISGVCDPREPYTASNGDRGVVYTLPTHAQDVPNTNNVAASTVNYWTVLNQDFPAASGWSFVTGQHLSDNSLQVTTYDAEHDDNSGFLANNGLPACPTCVGALFTVHYNPGANDPDPTKLSLHWIQVILDNHNITGAVQGHGVNENVVDHAMARSPYYDDGFAANATDFLDFPERDDDTLSHFWIAELLLVSGPAPTAPGQVTVYDGVRWGWGNDVPEPGVWMLTLSGTGILLVRRVRRSWSPRRLL